MLNNFLYNFFILDVDQIGCQLIDHNLYLEIGIDQIFVSNPSLNQLLPRILRCRISTENTIEEEDWRKLIKSKGYEWKIQLLSDLPGKEIEVNLFRSGPEKIVDKREINVQDIFRFLNNPETVFVPVPTLNSLTTDKFYSVIVEDQGDTDETVHVFIVDKFKEQIDLDSLYSTSPSSPPGPVSPGSLVIAPWKTNLLRAQEIRTL